MYRDYGTRMLTYFVQGIQTSAYWGKRENLVVYDSIIYSIGQVGLT